ncbi:biotin--[acetyl-CoA-carboxylase] ligase [Usitatibacter palustris]|uniref:Bifunctional ligase/repressor BirA n=1 Tax=Usitatibacter palustris TaxID=2732487 RepID=A0A6M4H2N9_9PROT|nr:biotin--[acetyl-CoA-carboxylase] ligase [Usitatibacter palustris]QJR13821.1 Bifunctional ligase/repressor BirA [Usitatibacter palustris]
MSTLVFQALRRLADGRFHSGEDIAHELGRSRATLSEALKRTDAMGLELFSVPGKGYRLAEPIEFLDVDKVLALAGHAATKLRLEVVEETDSTNSQMLARAMIGAPSGSCLAAEWQSAGRGRRGRSWVTALGGSLSFSLLWRFDRGAGHLAGLSLAVGIAVVRALRAHGVAGAQVKWPNDVLVDGEKLAGILVEASGEMSGPSVAVIGVGINYRLGERERDAIDQPVTDVVSHAASAHARNALLAAVLAELVEVLEAFEQSGFAALRDEWRSLHAFHRRMVRILPPQGEPYDAEVLDIANDGTLLIGVNGKTVKLASAEIMGSDPIVPSVRGGANNGV